MKFLITSLAMTALILIGFFFSVQDRESAQDVPLQVVEEIPVPAIRGNDSNAPQAVSEVGTTSETNKEIETSVDDASSAAEASLYTEPISVGSVEFLVEVADTPRTRSQGLSGVRSLGPREGKLFIFDTTSQHGMWMKDMHIALDMVWFDEDLEVIHIHEGVDPDTYPTVFRPSAAARIALEIPAGEGARAGITVGDQLMMRSELIPQDLR